MINKCFFFLRFRNHRPWEEWVSIHLPDSKYVCVLIYPDPLCGIQIHQYSWSNQIISLVYYSPTEICLLLTRGSGAKSHTVCEHSWLSQSGSSTKPRLSSLSWPSLSSPLPPSQKWSSLDLRYGTDFPLHLHQAFFSIRVSSQVCNS